MNVAIGKIKQLLCLAGDIAMFYLALFLTLAIRYGVDWQRQWQIHFLPFTIIYFSSLIVFYIIGLYDLSLARNNLFFFMTLTQALVISVILAVLFFYFIPYFGIAPKTNLFVSFLIFSVLFVLWRQFYNQFIKSSALLNNVLILGQDQETKELIQYVKNNPQLGHHIKKVLAPEEVRLLNDLIDIIIKEKIQTVVIDADPHKDKNLIQNLYQCLPLKIIVADLPTFYEKITGKIPVSAIGEIWFLQNLMNDQKTLFKGIKRIMDILFGILLGAPTLILTPLIALLIKIDSRGPIFYRQK
ncbi:MAG: sugar transferase, partial [Parcubacteria group bacterium GW2011_GWA2_43_9b]